MHLIEITIRDGTKRKLFLVPAEKANAIETLIKDVPRNEDGDELIDAGDVFPELRDPEKRPFITFRGIRAKTGLTQEELAKRLGITQADVSKIEGGKRPIGKALAKKIEKEFKIDYRRFL
jgi:DNA-binding XRE family transcriptional regulator